MLKNLVSLVTGAASGLGRATAKHLSEQGGCVVVCDLPVSEGQIFADTLKNAIFTPCNVASEDDVKTVLEVCKEKFGRLDVVVNCAGKSRAFAIANPRKDTYIDDKTINSVMSSNLYGTFNVIRLAVPMMYKNESILPHGQKGVIINVGASYAEDGGKCQSLIAAAKGAVSAMTLPLARELASLGIRVVTIAPGYFETPILSEEVIPPEVRVYFMDQMQFPKRFGHPQEFAQAVESVIQNPYINGEIIRLNGGLRQHCDYKFVDPDHDYSDELLRPRRIGILIDKETLPFDLETIKENSSHDKKKKKKK